jgi:hypothetical protein
MGFGLASKNAVVSIVFNQSFSFKEADNWQALCSGFC